MISALILAGRRAGEIDAVAQAAGVSCKAFAMVDSVPLIERVIAALLATGRIGAILIALPDGLPIEREAPGLAALLARGEVSHLRPELSPSATVVAALDRIDTERPLLVTTADHALLTASMVNQLIDGFSAQPCDAAVAMMPLTRLTALYPHIRRTRLAFQDGAFKGCNLFLFARPAMARRVASFWRRLEAQRKKPWRMAWRLGPVFLARYLLGHLRLEDAFAQVSFLSATKILPVLLTDPHAALDVDTPEDLVFIRRVASGNVLSKKISEAL